MKSWLALIAVISLGGGCDVGGGNLTATMRDADGNLYGLFQAAG